MYSVFGKFFSCHIGGTTITPNPQPASINASSIGRALMKGAPATHIKKIERKITPKGIPPNERKRKAFLAGLPLHKTFSFALKFLSSLDKYSPQIVNVCSDFKNFLIAHLLSNRLFFVGWIRI